MLTLRALSVRGLRDLYTWPAAKLENRSPYRQVRRPIGLGLMVVALGATLVVDTLPAWVCFFVWLVLTHIQLEVEEWEMRHRLPGARDYLKEDFRDTSPASGTRSGREAPVSRRHRSCGPLLRRPAQAIETAPAQAYNCTVWKPGNRE